VRNEFLLSARLDNLVSCFLATEALALHATGTAPDTAGGADDGAVGADAGVPVPAERSAERDICLIALFDHEEVGSGSSVGAGSPIMAEAVRRISGALR